MKRHTAVGQQARQRGFSLIEAMIAVVVLATGLLALTALQGSLIRNSADAKARSQLAAFAESALDRRRIDGFNDSALSPGTGQKLTTNTQLQQIGAAMGAPAPTESTTVTHFVANAGGVFPSTGCTTAACVTAAIGGRANVAQYKRVDLTLSWTDATGVGAARTLRMTTALSPLALSPNDVLVDRQLPEDANMRPIVRRPSPVTEGMIPIALGDGQDTAATNPKPELIGRSDDTLVSDTRFEVLTYDPTDSLGREGFVRFNKRIETAMVGCSCQTGTGGFPTGGSAPAINVLLRARAFRPGYWDGSRYAEPEPAVAAVDSSPDLAASQSQLCDVCCRDHKDPSGETGPRYNPWLPTGTAHDHYLIPTGSPVTGGVYREACRVIRVNGIWRVTPNPRTDDIALLATREYPHTTGSGIAPADNNRATRPEVSTSGKTSYISYAYDFIKQIFFDKNTSYDRSAGQTTAGLNNPDYVPIKPGDVRWLHTRGILVDFLEADAIDAIDDAIDDCASGASPTVKAQCVLPYLPLTTLNVTELAEWSGKETSETGIVHTGTLALATTLKNYGQALLNRFVSALALVGPVNPTDDDNPIKDEQTFALVPPATRTGTWLSVASPSGVLFGDPANPSRGFASIAGGTRFDIDLGGLPYATDNLKANDPVVNVGTASPQPCNSENGSQGGNSFQCTTDSTSNVDVAVGSFNYMDAGTGNVSNPCPGGTGRVGKQAICVAYTLAGSTFVSGTVGKPSEVRKVSLPTVTAGNTYTLNFSRVSPTANAAPVCGGATGSTFLGWTCD